MGRNGAVPEPILPTEKKLWVAERKPKSCIQAGELADKYEQVRKKDLPPIHKSTRKEGVKCHYWSKMGHLEKDCRKKMADSKERICFHCRNPGHIANQCPEKARSGSAMMGRESNRGLGQSMERPYKSYWTLGVPEQWYAVH